MKPSEVSAKLRQIAATIDNSERPQGHLVAADLRRVVAAMDNEYFFNGVALSSIDYVPPSSDEEPGMPSFRVKGVIGKPFDGVLSIELDGREIHYEVMSGVDPTGPEYEWESQDLYLLVGKSDAFKKAEETEGH